MQLSNEKEKLKHALSDYQQAKRDEADRIEQAYLEAQRAKQQRIEFLKRFGLDIVLSLMGFVEIIAGIKNRGMIFLGEFAGAFLFLWFLVAISALIVTLGRINQLQKGDLARLCRITLALLIVLPYVLPFLMLLWRLLQ